MNTTEKSEVSSASSAGVLTFGYTETQNSTSTISLVGAIDVTKILTFLVAAVLGAFIEFGNILTLISVALFRRLRRPKYIPVTSLALADAIVGLLPVFYVYEFIYTDVSDGKNVFGLVVISLCALAANSSGWHLAVMAMDRFLAIKYPIEYRTRMTRKRLLILSGICWTIGIMVAGSYFMYLPRVSFSTNSTSSCDRFSTYSSSVPLLHDFIVQFSQYVIVAVILTSLTISVLFSTSVRPGVAINQRCTSRSPSARLNGTCATNGGGCPPRDSVRLVKSPRAYKLVTIIIVFYLVAWGFFFIVEIFRLTDRFCGSMVLRYAFILSSLCIAMNSGVNFIVYAWMNQDFRHAYSTILLCAWKRTSPTAQQLQNRRDSGGNRRVSLLSTDHFSRPSQF